MAYDEVLANRIRELIGAERNVREQKMFGGLAFLINGNMAIAASGQGGVLVHVDPDEGDKLIAKSTAEPMEMRGKTMSGWLRVADDNVRTKPQLKKWVTIGVTHAKSLPPKKKDER